MDDEDVLEIGRRRGRRPWLAFVLAALVVGGVGGYLATRGDGGPAHLAAPTRTSTVPTPTPNPTRSLPPWPQVAGACGSTAFLPIVTARRLNERTGIRAVVGDRLRTVDVDTGAVTQVRGLPPGQFAVTLATARNGTYARLVRCDYPLGQTATVARLTRSGALQVVARGPFGDLLSGGDHPWGVIFSDSSNTATLDPLDGGRRRALPDDFGPVAAYRNLVVGTVSPPNAQPGAPFTIRVLDPVTGHVQLDLGPATSVTVDRGLIVWTGAHCTSCRLQVYDLATGSRTVTRQPVPAAAALWSGAVSPDRRSVAFLRQRSTAASYEMDHPGNPNEIVTVDLASGLVQTVPGVVLWPKSPVGMTFSADSRWLTISLDEGNSVRLLVWRPGMTAPLQSPASLTGKVANLPGLTTIA